MADQDYYYKYQLGDHTIDYFYDGESMMVFGTEKLEAAGIKISGKLTAALRQNATIDVEDL